MRKLIAVLMLTASVVPATALEVGDVFQLKFQPEIRLQTQACDSIQALRAGGWQDCGTVISETNWLVLRKAGDAVCIKSPYNDSNSCSWTVIDPYAIKQVVTAARPAPAPAATDQKTLDGLTGIMAYLTACDQLDKVTQTMMDNMDRLAEPFPKERRRASFENNMRMVKDIGVGKFCSELGPGFASALQALEHINWNLK
jgi:hypothetical protein